MLFYGSGKKYAQEIYDADKTLEPLQILKQVIESKKDPGVGGPMQSGSFHDKDFKINGVWEKEINEKEGKITTTKYRRAFKVENELEEATKYPYLGLSYSYQPVDLKK